jgi:hypothetical protein
MIHIIGIPIGAFAASGSKLEPAPKGATELHMIDPLADRRWEEFVGQHADASPFHRRGWLQALQRTYGYQPFVLTSAAPGEALKDGMPFCRISSWITGSRAVSLPFTDHCEPLVTGETERLRFMTWLDAEREQQGWQYVELRPLQGLQSAVPGWRPHHSYCFHELDLSPRLEQIFCGMHRDCIQRKVRRAEREGLSYEVGRSTEQLEAFYSLLLITRKRLRMLPQPRSWFHNLLECMGSSLQIRVARKDGRPVASLLTLRHRRSVIYKYGASDSRVHNLGGMPFLFWKLIEESKAEGREAIDFGRSDLENEGLIRFKDKFNAHQHNLVYYRSPGSEKRKKEARHSKTLGRLVSKLPDGLPEIAGRVLYRHMG